MHTFEKLMDAYGFDLRAIGDFADVRGAQLRKLQDGNYRKVTTDTIFAIADLAGCSAGEVADALAGYDKEFNSDRSNNLFLSNKVPYWDTIKTKYRKR